jgi:hypothetical protein
MWAAKCRCEVGERAGMSALPAKEVVFSENAVRWTCLTCRKQFWVKVATIFGLKRSGDLTALFMLHWIRYAMHTGLIEEMSGTLKAAKTLSATRCASYTSVKKDQRARARRQGHRVRV